MNKRAKFKKIDKIAINVKAHKILRQIHSENPEVKDILLQAKDKEEAILGMQRWIMPYFDKNPQALDYFNEKTKGRDAFNNLNWKDIGAIRMMDYIHNAGRIFEDINLQGELVEIGRAHV